MGMQKREVLPYIQTEPVKKVGTDISGSTLLTQQDKDTLLTKFGSLKNPAELKALEEEFAALGKTRSGQKDEADQLYKTILENPNQKIASKNPVMASYFGAVQNAMNGSTGITNK
jgi:hypothetical protein